MQKVMANPFSCLFASIKLHLRIINLLYAFQGLPKKLASFVEFDFSSSLSFGGWSLRGGPLRLTLVREREKSLWVPW